MTLVDTSVWVNHLRTGSASLISLLQEDRVLAHPYVIGELACGTLKNRTEILGLLQTLPEVRLPEHHEVLHFLESHQLFGKGLGWVDTNLLASAQLTGCGLWTAATRLQKTATMLGIPS